MNILILTTLYQQPDDTKDSATTPVVHNFAKEWIKQGHKVIVIHNANVFLKVLYYMPKLIMDRISNYLGFSTSLNIEQRKELHYIKDGVEIYRIPILKIIPMGAYTNKQLKKQFDYICELLKKSEFVPNVVVAHAENPQIYQLYHIKKYFGNLKTAIVFHGIEYLQRDKFAKWRNVYLSSIDAFGFRSLNLVRKAKELIDFDKPYFMCPSGISNEYVKEEKKREAKRPYRLLFVGQLIERKHPKTIMEAMNQLNDSYELTVIGDGSLRGELQEFCYNNEINVKFLGKISHAKVLEEMSNSDIFIMLSENEVFGLVYLEAMSQGCLTIASKREGMEGIIIDGKNGFLCEAGNTSELIVKLQEIEQMSDDRIKTIQHEAFVTAKSYSETEVAKKYLKAVVGE